MRHCVWGGKKPCWTACIDSGALVLNENRRWDRYIKYLKWNPCKSVGCKRGRQGEVSTLRSSSPFIPLNPHLAADRSSSVLHSIHGKNFQGFLQPSGDVEGWRGGLSEGGRIFFFPRGSPFKWFEWVRVAYEWTSKNENVAWRGSPQRKKALRRLYTIFVFHTII